MFRSIALATVLIATPIAAILTGSERNAAIAGHTFTPDAFTRLCPDHRGGGREFKGHGPQVTAKAWLSIEAKGTELWVTMYLHAKETTKDWTEAEKTWRKLLYSVPKGEKIKRVTTSDRSETSYTDTNHSLDAPAVRGGKLVKKFEIMGDTGGKDVSNCIDDDVYMNVYFNEIKLEFK